MDTKCLKATPENIKLCASAIVDGSVVAFPTETVYGLGASIFCPEAITKIFSLKNRPSDNPLIAHIHSLECVSKISQKVPKDFYTLAKVFFPGALTIVLKAHNSVPKVATASKSTIAIRMPKNKHALKLIEEAQVPIVAPSANLSGKPSATSALHVKEDFNHKIPLILDGGDCEIGIESTVILLDEDPYLLRPGAISVEEIEDILNKRINKCSHKHLGHSPGMKYRHYAPDIPVYLKSASDAMNDGFNNSLFLSSEPIEGLKVHLLTRQNLYELFRYAERTQFQEVVVIDSEVLRKDSALFDRIEKAVKRK